jgi:hypothetical protein
MFIARGWTIINYFNVANPGAYFEYLVKTTHFIYTVEFEFLRLSECMHACTLYIYISSFAWIERAIFLIGRVLEI